VIVGGENLGKITIRVMWDNPLYKDEAIRIMKEIERVLSERGYRLSRPEFRRNRKNPGGRIYIRVISREEESSRTSRRFRSEYAEY
jgi:hypothetical protein